MYYLYAEKKVLILRINVVLGASKLFVLMFVACVDKYLEVLSKINWNVLHSK